MLRFKQVTVSESASIVSAELLGFNLPCADISLMEIQAYPPNATKTRDKHCEPLRRHWFSVFCSEPVCDSLMIYYGYLHAGGMMS